MFRIVSVLTHWSKKERKKNKRKKCPKSFSDSQVDLGSVIFVVLTLIFSVEFKVIGVYVKTV